MKNIFILLILSFLTTPSLCQLIQRPDVGVPLAPQDLTQATDELIDILKRTHYFDFVDSRIQGWPESDPKHGYWWGTYWSGITVTKKDGLVTYTHANDGADNNGIRTAPYMESACYSYLLWKNSRDSRLMQKMVRGFSSWILASERSSQPNTPKILSRVFYPENIDSIEADRLIHIDYSASRPGINGEGSHYVHIPDNPTFGDIWVKNLRSRDDLGDMMRTMSVIKACEDSISPEIKKDISQMRNLYSQWGEDIDKNGFEVPTLDDQGNYTTHTDGTFDKLNHNVFLCWGNYALRLLHLNDTGNINCTNADFAFEDLFHSKIKNDALQIQRSMRIASVAMALSKNHTQDLNSMMTGLIGKIERDMKYVDGPWTTPQVNISDIPTMLINANNIGAPLTSKEIRWLHQRLHQAFVEIDSKNPAFHLFDKSGPDGTYSYSPPESSGMFFSSIGLMLGACASPYRNKDNRPLLDCERLQSAF